MSFRTSTNRILRLGGIFLASVVFVCLCPVSAQAGCGDYVVVTGSGANHSHSLIGVTDPAHLPLSLSGSSHTPLRMPCQGPNCSNRRSLPPLAPPAPQRLAVDQWAILPGDVATNASDEIVVPVTDPSLGFAMSHFSRIFRPPR